MDIKQLITKGKIDEALDLLGKRASGSDESTILLLQSRWNDLKSREMRGVISSSEATLESNKIRFAALELANTILAEPLDFVRNTNDMNKDFSPANDQPGKSTSGPKRIFFSYSKYDKEYLDQLQRQLAVLRRQKVILPWTDADILAGEEWDKTIKRELNTADVILLLVSSDFLATDYIWKVEIEQAMKRHERGEAKVIPIILRKCDWAGLPFSKLQALPTKGKPISSYDDRDQAWLEVVQGIKRIL